MKLSALPRVIKHNGQTLLDLNPAANIEDVVRMHAATIPELASAAIEGPQIEHGAQVYTVNTRVGTKG